MFTLIRQYKGEIGGQPNQSALSESVLKIGQNIALHPTIVVYSEHCTTLHCKTLHYTTLHCTALHCTTLHWTTLHYTTLHFTTLHCTTLHCTALQYTALHWTALSYTALHYTELHYTALHCTALHPTKQCKLNTALQWPTGSCTFCWPKVVILLPGGFIRSSRSPPV